MARRSLTVLGCAHHGRCEVVRVAASRDVGLEQLARPGLGAALHEEADRARVGADRAGKSGLDTADLEIVERIRLRPVSGRREQIDDRRPISAKQRGPERDDGFRHAPGWHQRRVAKRRRVRPLFDRPDVKLVGRTLPELAQRRERDALVQHLEAAGLDLAQQRAVDVGHHQAGLLRAAVGLGQQRQRFVVAAVRALGLEAHQGLEALLEIRRLLALQDLVRLDVEALQLRNREVDASAPRVVAHVLVVASSKNPP